MSTSRAPAAVDQLYALLTAALGTANPVWDGPPVTGDFRDCVYLGYDGDPSGERRSVTGQQEWAGIGAKKRSETLDIICAAAAISGDGTAKPARDKVYALMGQVETTLRADPSMGQSPTPFVASVHSPELFFEWIEQMGLQARLTFHVLIETRI